MILNKFHNTMLIASISVFGIPNEAQPNVAIPRVQLLDACQYEQPQLIRNWSGISCPTPMEKFAQYEWTEEEEIRYFTTVPCP
jgi:hypothetical protein